MGQRGRDRAPRAIRAGAAVAEVDRMRRNLRVCLSLAMVAATACGGVRLDPAADAIRFNEHLHGDLWPLSRVDQPPFPGFRAPDGRVSDAMPGVGPELQRQLRRSQCFWMPPGEVDVSWELVARALPSTDADLYSHLELDPDKPTVPIEVGACTMTDPIDREPPVDEHGQAIDLAFDSTLAPGTAAVLTACTGPAVTDNPCQPERTTCVDVPRPCPTDQVGYPLCGQQCPVAISRDTTLRLEVRADLSGTGLETTNDQPVIVRAKEFRTTFKVAAPSTTLARPLARTDTTTRFTWATPEQPDGSWQESFHPGLVVARVRVVARANGERRYLRPAKIDVDGRGCTPDAGGTVTLEQCPQLGGLTPTNWTNALDHRVTWGVELAAADVRPGTSYQLEFVVIDRAAVVGSNLPVVTWREPSLDLGDYDYRATLTRRMWLENNGARAVVVTGNSTSTRFQLRPVTGDLGVGVTVPAHGSVAIDVTRLPLATPPAGAAIERTTLALSASGVAVEATVRGRAIDFGPPLGALVHSAPLTGDRRRIVVVNHARNPARITGAAVTGPDAAALALAAVTPCDGDPLCKGVPMIGGEVRLYQVDRTEVCPRASRIPVVFEVEECITPGGTCDDGDDWRPAPAATVEVALAPTARCP